MCIANSLELLQTAAYVNTWYQQSFNEGNLPTFRFNKKQPSCKKVYGSQECCCEKRCEIQSSGQEGKLQGCNGKNFNNNSDEFGANPQF